MKAIVELIVRAMVKGLIYSVGFGIVGGLAGWFLKKGFITGAYSAVLFAACIAMLVAAWGFIGSPQKRFSFFTQNRYKKSTENETDEKPEDLSAGGFYPALIAVEMLIIGFIIEALLH